MSKTRLSDSSSHWGPATPKRLRRISGMENFYLAIEAHSPFYVQWVLDFANGGNRLNQQPAAPDFSNVDLANIDFASIDWPQVLNLAAAANPIANLRIRSGLLGSYWHPSAPTYSYRETSTAQSLTQYLMGLPKNLGYADDQPTIELIQLNYNVEENSCAQALIFRCLHSLMDGRGAWEWMCACIALANSQIDNENCEIDSSTSPTAASNLVSETTPFNHSTFFSHTTLSSDGTLSKQLEGVTDLQTPPSKRYKPLTQGVSEQPNAFFQLRLSGNAHGLSLRLARYCRDFARTRNIPLVNMMIPSDLRKYDAQLRSHFNHTGIYRLAFASHCSDDELFEQFQQLKSQRQDVAFIRKVDVLKFLPNRLLRKILNRDRPNKRYSATGFISNLGELDAKPITLRGCSPSNAFVLSPLGNVHALFITTSSYRGELTLNISIPAGLQGNADEFVTYLQTRLTNDDAHAF